MSFCEYRWEELCCLGREDSEFSGGFISVFGALLVGPCCRLFSDLDTKLYFLNAADISFIPQTMSFCDVPCTGPRDSHKVGGQ